MPRYLSLYSFFYIVTTHLTDEPKKTLFFCVDKINNVSLQSELRHLCNMDTRTVDSPKVEVKTKKLNSWLIKNRKAMEQMSVTQVSSWLESNCEPQCWIPD